MRFQLSRHLFFRFQFVPFFFQIKQLTLQAAGHILYFLGQFHGALIFECVNCARIHILVLEF